LESDVVDLDEFPVPMDRCEEEEPWNNDKHFSVEQARNDEFPFSSFWCNSQPLTSVIHQRKKVVPRCVANFFGSPGLVLKVKESIRDVLKFKYGARVALKMKHSLGDQLRVT
jgi:hypothetical protein